ncbi:uncharacterized protein I206_102517 [Kwoniella pini CBS 10737]|uniref:RNA-dependent RNA polymerase n=1 Tax=Kwoniella pini CBS 10737 TaxID=1296096 RepID=A0A1B9I5Q4_9TREE|nr:uncharacterized protein I206_02868 [Kwoniella pini CBS 10737]OCF50811.1 hypothetical protein I206_02868 [Kwoniella pini CBS 10737]
MTEDDWNFDTYHPDIQHEYEKLLEVHPSLGRFRAPRSSDTDTFRLILDILRLYMSAFHLAFPDFVDTEISLSGLRQLEAGNNREITGKLTRMIDPLLTFSQRLMTKLREASENYGLYENPDALGQYCTDSGGEDEFEENMEKDEWKPDSWLTKLEVFDQYRHAELISSRDSSPSKRSSSDEDSSESAKRFKITSTNRTPDANSPFASKRSFSKTTSAPQVRLSAIKGHVLKTSTTPKLSLQNDLGRFDSSDSGFTLSTSTSRSNSTISTISTPSTSISIESSGNQNHAILKQNPLTATDAHLTSSIVVNQSPYTAFFNKQGINFYLQWELDRLISQHETLKWRDFQLSELSKLKGKSVLEAVSLIGEIIDSANRRITSHQQMGTSRPRSTKISDRKALLLTEVENEEASIMANDLHGVGTERVDWPYGGRIQYTISVQMADKNEGCFEKTYEPPTLSQENNIYHRAQRTFSRSTSLPSQRKQTLEKLNGHEEQPIVNQAQKFPFKLVLRPPEMPGKSCRLARRFGSRRIISLKIKDVPNRFRSELKAMLAGRCFVILGRPYRALWCTADGEGVMLVEVPEHAPGSVTTGRELEPSMPTFLRILDQYNDLSQKPNQAMAKWAARLQILFSDSIPATQVDPWAVGEDQDIVADDALPGNATTEQILTDGCGLMSESLAQRIFRCPSLTFSNGRPSVVQMRIGGSKGLLALMSTSQMTRYPGKDIILRPSMIKFLSAPDLKHDPSLLTLDILRCESLKIESSLTHEAMVVMVHNGVAIDTFLDMARNQLESLRDDFIPARLEGETEEDVLNRIVSSCYGRGGVGQDRKKRIAKQKGKSFRAAGIDKGHGKNEKRDDEEDEDPLVVKSSERYDVDPISGQPGSIDEALMQSVASGFHPAKSMYAALKLHNLVEDLSKKMTREFKSPVKQSLTAFIVPDSLGLLAPNELFICFSNNGPIDENTQIPMTHLEGDVLAYRSPCKLPTDVRKFRAVYKPELAHLKDCIVLSANSRDCIRSPASFLGGGDYDGDTVTIMWAKELVEPFNNSPDDLASTPKGFEEQNFDKSVVKGTEFLDRIKGLNEAERVREMQGWLLDAVLGDQLTGTYSDLHGNAIYTKGLDDPETLRLGRMFCNVLDARKSGLRVKAEIKSKDLKLYSGEVGWRTWRKEKGQEDYTTNTWNSRELIRPKSLGPFVMDVLMEKGEKCRKIMMGSFLKEPTTLTHDDYQDLCLMWNEILKQSDNTHNRLQHNELETIEKHVDICYKIRQSIVQGRCGDIFESYETLLKGGLMKEKPRSGASSPTKQQKKIESAENKMEMSTKTRQLAYIWQNEPSFDNLPIIGPWGSDIVGQLKLSCLSVVSAKHHSRTKQVCGFDLDFTRMCEMKAKALGGNTRTMLSCVSDNLKPATRF